MPLATWLPFFAACWLISLSPGPGAVAAMSAGLALGFRRGYCLTFGLILGLWTQIVVVVAGLGALLQASSGAFLALKLLGAAYLVWLGCTQGRESVGPLAAQAAPARSRASLVLRGWGLNAINPKGTLFMLAVVPQFVDPGRPLAVQYGVIALSLAATDLVVMAAYTAFAARVLRAFREPRHVRWMNRVFGGAFVVAGALLAAFRRTSA